MGGFKRPENWTKRFPKNDGSLGLKCISRASNMAAFIVGIYSLNVRGVAYPVAI